MDKDFIVGMMLGVLGGAILSTNSFKVRNAVKDGQEQVISAINKMNGENKQLNKEQQFED